MKLGRAVIFFYAAAFVVVCPTAKPQIEWLALNRPNWLPFKPALTALGEFFKSRLLSGSDRGRDNAAVIRMKESLMVSVLHRSLATALPSLSARDVC